MIEHNNLTNYKYYRTTTKSGCISLKYNFKDDIDQKIIINDNFNEISGNYFNK